MYVSLISAYTDSIKYSKDISIISVWSYTQTNHEYIRYISIFLFYGHLFFSPWPYILCIKCFKYICIFWTDNIIIIHTFHEFIKYSSIFLLKGHLFFNPWAYLPCIKCFFYLCILYTHQLLSIFALYQVFQVFLYILNW